MISLCCISLLMSRLRVVGVLPELPFLMALLSVAGIGRGCVAAITALLYRNRIEKVARDVDLGAAEDADVDDKTGAVVGAGEHVAFKAHELAAVDAHLFAAAEGTGVDGYPALGIVDHAHEAAYLAVGDDGDGAVAVFGTAGDVDHEALDVRQKHNLLAAHELGAADEDEGGEDDALNELAAAVAPLAHLFLRGNIHLIVFCVFGLRGNACLKPFATELFGVVVNYGDVPMFGVFSPFLYAYGVGGSCYRRTILLHWCITVHNNRPLSSINL